MAKKGGTPENLRTPTTEEARYIGMLGGKKSAEVRRKKKDLKDAALALLNMTGYKVEGLEEDVDGNTAVLLALMKKALDGNVQAFATLRDTAGQKPVETVNVNDSRPKAVEIAFVDKSKPKQKQTDPKIIGESSPNVGSDKK